MRAAESQVLEQRAPERIGAIEYGLGAYSHTEPPLQLAFLPQAFVDSGGPATPSPDACIETREMLLDGFLGEQR
jgi:hypothetical protein